MKCQNHLQQAAHNHKEVKTVEQRHKITLKLQRFSSYIITGTITSSLEIHQELHHHISLELLHQETSPITG